MFGFSLDVRTLFIGLIAFFLISSLARTLFGDVPADATKIPVSQAIAEIKSGSVPKIEII